MNLNVGITVSTEATHGIDIAMELSHIKNLLPHVFVLCLSLLAV